MCTVTLNGKFLTAAPTGVHRVATELLSAADRHRALHSGPQDPWRLLTPNRPRADLQLTTIRTEARGLTSWQPWEQFELPLLAKGSLLVSLCNLGPLLSNRQVVMMHDAQVFSSPASYSSKFRAWYRFAQPILGRRAEAVLTVSEFSKSQLLHYGVVDREEKIFVVYNGVDHLSATHPLKAGSEARRTRPFVLGLANTQTHKNISLLLQAFTDPRLTDIELVLVGKATRADFLALGQPPPANVTFAGPVSDDELRSLYRQALCLAFPSTTEGFGLPPLEAMAAGCPALVAPCGALPEVCGGAALYAPPDDARSWSDQILLLAAGGEARRALISLGLAQAERFTWGRSAKRLLEVIDAVR